MTKPRYILLASADQVQRTSRQFYEFDDSDSIAQSMVDLFEDYLLAQKRTSKGHNNLAASDEHTDGVRHDPNSTVPYSPMVDLPQPSPMQPPDINVERKGYPGSDNKENKAEFENIEYTTDELFGYMDKHFGELVCLVEDETTDLYVPYATSWIKELVYLSMKRACTDDNNRMDVDFV